MSIVSVSVQMDKLYDNTIKLWDFNINSLTASACNWVKNYLQNNPNVSESDRHLCEK